METPPIIFVDDFRIRKILGVKQIPFPEIELPQEEREQGMLKKIMADWENGANDFKEMVLHKHPAHPALPAFLARINWAQAVLATPKKIHHTLHRKYEGWDEKDSRQIRKLLQLGKKDLEKSNNQKTVYEFTPIELLQFMFAICAYNYYEPELKLGIHRQ